MLPATINRRYKFGFFLTLVAVGLCLLFDASLKQTAGALILGISAALLLGGLKVRTLQIIGCLIVSASGVAIVAARLMSWRDTTEQAAHEYDNAILDLKDAIASPKHTIENAPTPPPLPPGYYDENAVTTKPPLPPGGRGGTQTYSDLPPGAIVVSAGNTLGESQIDIVRHPRLGMLMFPKSMPYDERNRVIEELEKKRTAQLPADLQKYLVPKETATQIIELPASAKKWERRLSISGVKQVDFLASEIKALPTGSTAEEQSDEAGSFMVISSIPFPGDKSDLDIMQYFQSDILRPRPVLSLKVALRAELRSVLLGLVLFVVGVLGCIWLTGVMRRHRSHSAG